MFLKFDSFVNENYQTIFYHGTPDINLIGRNGIHIGTKKAASQALQARIGIPVIGEWDGTREYGKTLLCGKKSLKDKEKELGYYCITGFNCGGDVPEEDYYPSERNTKANYSDRSIVPLDVKPIIFPVKIIGRMSNTQYSPHSDMKANSLMKRSLTMGNAKSGFYYINEGEDEGSISAVVPDKSFLEFLS